MAVVLLSMQTARCLARFITGNDGRGLVVDSDLEASRAPVHKLDRALGLDGGNGSGDVLGAHVSAVEQAARHVLAVARVTLHHLVARLKAAVGDFGDGQLLVVSLGLAR